MKTSVHTSEAPSHLFGVYVYICISGFWFCGQGTGVAISHQRMKGVLYKGICTVFASDQQKDKEKKKTKRHTEKTANVIQKREDVPGTKCSPLGVLTFPFPSRHSRSSPCCARRSTARSRARHDTGPARCRVVT
ncbi:MC150R [Molluscum contagiosum virus]|uniref:MC150R n=1 Tax=Molluscum contagiosum virus TaxID=10279 RepID=A0A858A4N3_9POXV|nr:MC150R [Molluscum contagiosum virus]QHW17075.1 MC150R [Molluscum contagiosum virus]QHW17257.1 MC150R [Molluscum contagiosum virus]